jgi:DUF1680 family protein
MSYSHPISRRSFLHATALTVAGTAASRGWSSLAAPGPSLLPLSEFSYGDVAIRSELHERQLHESHDVLMSLSDDSLLKPLRAMSGQPAPGEELGGWYLYKPDFDYRSENWDGFAPACTFGQWVSALARYYAITGNPATRERVLRLNRLYAKTISGDFYVNNRFPAYCYDKFVCGLIDSHKFVGDSDAFAILNHTTDVATPHLPGKAIEHDVQWRPDKHDPSWTWDESYTISENLFLAYQRGAGERYKSLAIAYLDDTYYDPLSEGRSNLQGRHAYSHVNSLCSAMQAWLTLGSEKHLRAASNGFGFLQAQSFATGGWGPDETLRAPDSDDVFASLSNSHSSFETPCGSYAHFKLTRYLLRVTRDSRYGDSMERVMYNTILGARPLQADGSTFYYADCNFDGHKVYKKDHWPCCSGTFPQIAADYRISAFFRDAQGIYVNLYLPSTLHWVQDSTAASLTQTTAYPFDPLIRLDLKLARPSTFTINLRIPAWAQDAAISINGTRFSADSPSGSFAAIRREWKSGDRIELNLPLAMRLEPINARHTDTVALLSGPLVLFPINEKSPSITKHQLLAAKKVASQKWQAETSSPPLTLLPFTSIDSERYSTYLKLT